MCACMRMCAVLGYTYNLKVFFLEFGLMYAVVEVLRKGNANTFKVGQTDKRYNYNTLDYACPACTHSYMPLPVSVITLDY